jgi:N4-gp56 family major capsid protein
VAATTPTNVDSSIPEIWARLTLRDSLRAGFWSKFTGGEGSRSPIIRRTELLNNPGDTIHISVTDPLAGAGVQGDTTLLEGSEENLLTSDIIVIPDLFRHAVLFYRRANVKSMLDLRNEAQMRLAEWGQEKMDDLRFANYVSAATMNGQTYTPKFTVAGGGTVGAVDVVATDTLSVDSIQRAKLAMYNNRAMPLRTSDGNDFFGLVAHPNSLYNLKRETEYRDWVKDAEVRGAGNPFFQGAVAMIDGVVLYQHNNVPVANDGTGSIAVSRNLMFGAEAFVEGVSEDPHWNEDDFDYGNRLGVAYAFAFQSRRALPKNSLILYAAAVAPT